MIIDAGLDVTEDWRLCGVDTLERVDAGDAEFDLEPNPAVRLRPMLEGEAVPPPVEAVAIREDGKLLAAAKVAADADSWGVGLNGVLLRGGEIDRVIEGVDKVEVKNEGAEVVGAGTVVFSCCDAVADAGSVPAEVRLGVESALTIGMSLTLGDVDDNVDDVREFAVALPNPRLT